MEFQFGLGMLGLRQDHPFLYPAFFQTRFNLGRYIYESPSPGNIEPQFFAITFHPPSQSKGICLKPIFENQPRSHVYITFFFAVFLQKLFFVLFLIKDARGAEPGSKVTQINIEVLGAFLFFRV
jgi:hypothetical protein